MSRYAGLGVPAEISDAGEIVLVIAGLYGAVTVPESLGQQLQRSFAGPVLAWKLSTPPLWTFLVVTNIHPQGAALAILTTAGAVICPPGVTIALPPELEGDAPGDTRWITPPDGHGLPRLSTVVAAIGETALVTS